MFMVNWKLLCCGNCGGMVEMNIQFAGEQEQLKQDSENLKVDKSCLNCKHENIVLGGIIEDLCPVYLAMRGFEHKIQIPNYDPEPDKNVHCSLHELKDGE